MPASSVPSVHIGIGTLDGKPHEECVRGILSAWGSLPCSISFVRGPYIGRNRDVITAEFLAGDCSHVLYVDADIEWNVEHLRALLALDAPFSFAPYAYKDGSGREVARRGSSREGLVFEYERCGAGFVLVRRDAIEAMVERYAGELSYVDPKGRELHGLWWQGGYTTNEIGKRIVEGEDYAFCRRWREMCGRIVAREGLTVGHVGSRTYRVGE